MEGFVTGFVQLPDEVKVRISALVLALVGFFLAKLIELVPFLNFLEDFRLPLSLALAGEFIALIEFGVPDAYGAAAVFAIQLILELVALVLVFVKLRERGVKGFK